MLRDARDLEDGALLECDLCIVGGGAAGIAMARELAGGRLQICLLESGGLGFEPAIQDLYVGENVGLPYDALDQSRLRYFGGTTNHWTGRCVPLDPIDFERRDWLPYSGWPISRADLEPFYRRAQAVCRLGPFEYADHFWYAADERELALDETRLRHRFWHDHPLAFGQAYRAELEQAANVDVVLHANVTDIEANDALSAIERLEVRTLDGRRLHCRARDFVLACGGLETPRLLLASNLQARDGLGNAHGNVGRFFMEHPATPGGRAVVMAPETFSSLYWRQDAGDDMPDGLGYLDCLTLAPEQMRRDRILNVAWRFYDQDDPANDTVNGYAGLRRVVGALQGGELPDDLTATLGQMVADLDGTLGGLLDRLGVISYDYVPATCTFWAVSEQAPNPDSRVALSGERDALGQPRPKLDWRLSELDRRTLRTASRLLAEEFGRAGIGRVQLADWLDADDPSWPSELRGSFHHIGTTRMSDDPKRGVVDANCRVHGLANLYVAGSSVFPTAGWANPTLTIVALAIRLADHLAAGPSG